MTTAEEIQAELARVQEATQRECRRTRALFAEAEAAKERQRLRRELDAAKGAFANAQSASDYWAEARKEVDADKRGPHLPGNEFPSTLRPQQLCQKISRSASERISCSDSVRKGEYLWSIEGMSWLSTALAQDHEEYLRSDDFVVGDSEFRFVYHPGKDPIIGWTKDEAIRSSLAIQCLSEDEVAFRHKILVQRADGQFVQWGPQGDELKPTGTEEDVFGPDVRYGRERGSSTGIFGLAHEELLQSEWVNKDVLTIKFQLEVRMHKSIDDRRLRQPPNVQVPESTMHANLLSMFEQSKNADVSFLVKGETIQAHSQVLSAHSEVFERQLHGGMREATSKEVTIDDCEASVFRAFLKYFYTDHFTHIHGMMRATPGTDAGSQASGSAAASTGSGTATTSTGEPSLAPLQGIMSLAHKYQVPRLLSWCEQQLCEHLSIEDVCPVLCQAHLCEAQQLEQVCLKLIKENMEKVSATEEFADLTGHWPEVSLKIILFGSGVSTEKAATVVSAQQRMLRKRKHE